MTNKKIIQVNPTNGTVLCAQDLGIVAVDKEHYGSPKNFSVAVRVLLQNWRQGTVACKNRSQVSGSNRKPWKQKGTGRARAGAVTSPIWRGGGIVFGPQARVRSLRVSKKLWKVVALELLHKVLNNQRLLAVDWALETDRPNTKQAYVALKNAGIAGVQINVFLNPQDGKTVASFVNIPNVRVVYMDAPNAYDLSDAQYWVVFKNNMDAFKKMVMQWT